MGNRSSSVQPSGPPPLLSAAVVGNIDNFGTLWTGEKSFQVRDGQGNNVLHALFSCRGDGKSNCSEILNRIHGSLSSTSLLTTVYSARNTIGCTPLWILVAYGNVSLLKEVRQKFAGEEKMDHFLEILRQNNKQGDSPLLATCSQGNVDMVRFLKEEILSSDQFDAAISTSNKNGTSPLQIIVGNNHASLLDYMLREEEILVRSQLLNLNKAGLSLFHICSERNAHEILKTILTFATKKESNEGDDELLKQVMSLKDKNGANALHVAAFCGNIEAVQVWISVIKESHPDKEISRKESIISLLDILDGEGRTAYWLGMLQGRDQIGKLLADEGVNTSNPKMVKEIEEAQQHRSKGAKSKQKPSRTIDGSALIDKSVAAAASKNTNQKLKNIAAAFLKMKADDTKGGGCSCRPADHCASC